MKKEQQKSLNGKTFITRLNYKVAVLQSLPHTSLPMGYLRAAESSTASRTSSRSLYSTRLWPQFLMPALSFSPFGPPVKLLFFFFFFRKSSSQLHLLQNQVHFAWPAASKSTEMPGNRGFIHKAVKVETEPASNPRQEDKGLGVFMR